MKAKSILFSMLAAAAMVGCSSDDVLENDGQQLENGTAYMKVRIALPSEGMSRGTDGGFTNGTKAEQTIQNIQFVFYNADDTYFGMGASVGATNTTPTTPGEGNNVEAISDAVVALNTKDVDAYPAKVVAFVNTTGLELEKKSLKDALALADAKTTVKIGETNYFTMTSSAYLDGSKSKCWSDVSSANFYETSDAALSASNAVQIYVERVAAKVKIAQSENINIEDVTIGGNTLKFTIDGMALNATNTKSYYIKNVSNYGDLSFTWNDANNFRSYWATDPNYDSALEGDFDYKSWNEVVANKSNAEYCLENTFSTAVASADKFNYDESTHALVAGHYELNGAQQSFYIYAGVLYTQEDMIKKFATTVKDQVWKLNDTKDAYVNPSVEEFELTRGSSGSKATLALKSSDITYFKDKEGKEAYANLDEVNGVIRTMVGDAEAYTNGSAYFAVPIQHLGAAGTVGEYGIVRNHCYQLTINSIKNLGTGVYDPENEPIKPEVSEKNYYVGATLNILSWKVVNQDVEL